MLKLALAILFITPAAFAQGSTTFDVASIHPHKPGDTNFDTDSDATHYNAQNVSLEILLQSAYDLRPDQIRGIPASLANLRLDVSAKVLDPDLKRIKSFTDEQQAAMLIPVLQSRFALKAHFELRTAPIFDLVALPGRPKLSPLPGTQHGSGNAEIHNHELTASAVTLDQFARMLATLVHKPVLNKTGLEARYDIGFKWSPLEGADPDDPNPPLLTAIQEQLGLKLKPSKGPVPTLIVDHIEAPTDN